MLVVNLWGGNECLNAIISIPIHVRRRWLLQHATGHSVRCTGRHGGTWESRELFGHGSLIAHTRPSRP